MMRECPCSTKTRDGLGNPSPPPSRFPLVMGFAPRDPRDFPRAKPEGNPEGRGVQNPWPREISRAEGMDFPIPPESWWSTDILSSLPGKALIGFHRYLMKTNENQPLLIKTYEQWKPTNTNEWKICIWWHLCIWVFCSYLFLNFCAGLCSDRSLSLNLTIRYQMGSEGTIKVDYLSD